MAKRALTAAAIERLKPPASGQVEHFDAGFPGLGCRISHGGAKTFIYLYRVHGKQRRMTLGRWPATTLAEAREAWREARKAIERGEDPMAKRPSNEFAAVAEEWMLRDQGDNRSRGEVQRVLNRDVLPAWRGRSITEIGRRDCLGIIDGIADRGAMIMARRTHSYLSRLFKWAVGRGIIDASPMAGLPKPGSEVGRDRVLSDDELRVLWRVASEMAWPFGAAIQLLILSGARRDEISMLRTSEIQGDELVLAQTKTLKAHRIPLSDTATGILATLPRIKGSPFVFTTTGKTPISGWSKAKVELDRAMLREINPELMDEFARLSASAGEERALEALGFDTVDDLTASIVPPWRIHDLRRTMATGMQRLGISLQVVEAVLGHVSGSRSGVVGIYQRYEYAEEKRQALKAWSNFMAALLGEAPANVVRLARA